MGQEKKAKIKEKLIFTGSEGVWMKCRTTESYAAKSNVGHWISEMYMQINMKSVCL